MSSAGLDPKDPATRQSISTPPPAAHEPSIGPKEKLHVGKEALGALKTLGGGLEKAFYYVVKFKWVDDASKLVTHLKTAVKKQDVKAAQQFSEKIAHKPAESAPQQEINLPENLELKPYDDYRERTKATLEVGTLLHGGNLKYEVRENKIYAKDSKGDEHPIQAMLEYVGEEQFDDAPLQRAELNRYRNFRDANIGQLQSNRPAFYPKDLDRGPVYYKDRTYPIENKPVSRKDAQETLESILRMPYHNVTFVVDNAEAKRDAAGNARIFALVVTNDGEKFYDVTQLLEKSDKTTGIYQTKNVDRNTLEKLNGAILKADNTFDSIQWKPERRPT